MGPAKNSIKQMDRIHCPCSAENRGETGVAASNRNTELTGTPVAMVGTRDRGQRAGGLFRVKSENRLRNISGEKNGGAGNR